MNTNFTKRGSIKQLLDRESIYNVQDYSRKVSKRIGRYVPQNEILIALNHMKKEGQLEYNLNGKAIVGCTFRRIA